MIIPSLVASYFRSRISNAFVGDSLWSLSALLLYNRTEAGHWELQMITDRPPRGKRLLEEFGKSETANQAGGAGRRPPGRFSKGDRRSDVVGEAPDGA